ncbi:mitogen-activated protein kinase kinase kinase 20-like [Solanum stenotomum]|uniref:mitogen-activated protein kinase kinase kinase 20-like n=1 Tax=Solanum stenotomum TaxID=172797 RepID=UPI0020D02E20|nr:mitogen-activated protein kinase kinase kinase 20-like [Solanum stenotomum]
MEENQAKFKWQRGRTLGKGSYGFVSLASTDTPSPMIPSLIAVKSCMLNRSQSLRNEREFLGMFEDCPQIIRCFGFNVTYEDDLYLYNLLLEFASAGSLADRINERGLPEFQVQKHTKNILLGLSLIHKKGIIHCDIKPQNILLTTDGADGMAEVAKIADFGLSINLEQNKKENMGYRGTKRYMAPEALIKEKYYPGVDIWSLGCTVYEMITGKPLWESSNSDQMLDRIKYKEPNIENPKLSTKAKDFLNNCLVRNPSARWSADMLLNHSFLKSVDNVQPPDMKKRLCDGMSLLRKKRTKTAFRTQPHIRDLVIQLDSDSKDGNSCLN